MKIKYDVLTKFIAFKTFVERRLDFKIKAIQADVEGEYKPI